MTPDGKKRQVGLPHAVKTWPIPDASVANDGETLESWEARRERVKATGINGNGMGTPLAVAARLWPTATTGDANGSGSAGYSTESGRSEGTTLTDAAVRGIRAGAPQSKSIKGLKLNPAWVEQLMGFPPGWTLLGPASPKPNGKRPASSRKRKTGQRASKPSATPSSRKSPRSSGDGC
jgi:DNA (cytosine-5)-methyltransferase 1